MPVGAAFVALTEYRVAARDLERGIFASPPPRRVDAAHLRRDSLLRPLPGQRGGQHFFSLARRAFCLYIVLSDPIRAGVLAAANRSLGSFDVEPG
jgi:hypothetical protein